MATILARITVRPGCTEQFEQLARELYAQSHADEPHLNRYEYARGQAERTYYTFFDFDRYEHFLDHQASEHHEHATPGLRAVIESITLEWLDPLVDASPLASAQRGAADLGALDEVRRAHAARHPLVVPAWWPAS